MSERRGVIAVLAARGAGSLAMFALMVLTGRLFGPQGLGQVFTVLATGWLVAQGLNFGTRRMILAGHRGLSDAQLRGFASASALAACGLCAPWVLYLGPGAAPASIVVGAAMAVLACEGDLAKSKDRAAIGLMIELAALPAMSAVLIGVMVWRFPGAPSVPLVSLAAAAGLAMTVVAARAEGALQPDPRPVLRRARELLPYWGAGILVTLGARFPGLAAPLQLAGSDLGVFAAQVSVVALGGSISYALQARYAPRFADSSAGLSASQWAGALAFAPILLVGLVWPAPALSVYGISTLTDAQAAVFGALLVAQFLRLLCGNAEVFLSMSGRPDAEIAVLIIALAGAGFCLLLPLDGLTRVSLAYGALLVLRGGVALAFAVRLGRSGVLA